MKRFKNAFTLAEVLITLAIIGIVAAIVMPSVISSYQYKTLGVKLSKFISSTENVSRAFVVANRPFESKSVGSGETGLSKQEKDFITFVNEAYIIKEVKDQTLDDVKSYYGSSATLADYPYFLTFGTSEGEEVTLAIASLKDNTKLGIEKINGTEEDLGVLGGTIELGNAYDVSKKIDTTKVGNPAYRLVFMPEVAGMPDDAQKEYRFMVTTLGYLYPSMTDPCLWSIYENDWSTTSQFFARGHACNTANTAD